jgi:hypothetical protein
MKKILVLSIALIMIAGVAFAYDYPSTNELNKNAENPLQQLDLSVFDNWKGVLGGRDITLDDHYYGDAEGHVIFNYRKGQKDYMVNMVVSGLEPGVEYDLKFLVTDPESDFVRQYVGYFKANRKGIGSLNVIGFEPEVKYFANEPEAFFSVYKGAWRVLTTSSLRGGEDIEPVGSNRGE